MSPTSHKCWRLLLGLLVGCGSASGGGGWYDPDGVYLADGQLAETSGADGASDTKTDTTSQKDATADGTKSKGETGDPCTTNSDCKGVPGGECFQKIDPQPAFGFPGMTWPGGYCSKGCTDEDQNCGEVGQCQQSGSGGGQSSWKMHYCAKSCQQDSECRVAEGYKCQIVLFGFGICAPGVGP